VVAAISRATASRKLVSSMGVVMSPTALAPTSRFAWDAVALARTNTTVESGGEADASCLRRRPGVDGQLETPGLSRHRNSADTTMFVDIDHDWDRLEAS
jgi:hypothetical protein